MKEFGDSEDAALGEHELVGLIDSLRTGTGQVSA